MASLESMYKLVDGFKVPAEFSEENVLSCFKYKPKDEDLFLATYPRSGTNWTRHLIYLIQHKGEPAPNHVEFHLSSAFIDMIGVESLKTKNQSGLIVTHFPFDRVPYSPSAKYINIARNPKDCFTSQYHIYEKYNFGLDEFIDAFIIGNKGYGSYFDHVLSWYHHCNDPNVLFLTYEEMKKDIRTAVLKIATFMGEEYKDIVSNDDVMNKIIAQSDVKSVGKLFDVSNFKPEDDDLPPWYKKLLSSYQFIRKGITGDWKNLLSKEQAEKFNAVFYEKMKGTELIDIWKEYLY